MAGPWLSVIMPVFNGAAYLQSALDSIVAQGDPAIEVVAIDDGSTDETPEILRSYRDQLDLSIHRRPRNGDQFAAVNLGIGLARGEYQCWLHHDDAWEAGRLAVLREYAGRWPEAVMILHPSWFIDPQGNCAGLWRCPLPPNRLLDPNFVVSRLLVQNFAASPAPLYKSSVIASVGPLDERLWYNADWDFWLRIAETGMTVYCPRPLARYRVHPDSLTSRRTADAEALRAQFDLVLDRYLEKDAAWSQVAGPARFSAMLNIQLLRWAAGGKLPIRSLIREFLRLGPRGWHRYFRDSRIRERAWSRVRVGALSRTGWKSRNAGGTDRGSPAALPNRN